MNVMFGTVLAAGLIVATVLMMKLRGSRSGSARRREDGATFFYGSDASGSSDRHCDDGASAGDCGSGDGDGGGGDGGGGGD